MAFTSLLTGIIIKGVGGFYYVKTQDKIFECKARGVFRKDGLIPLPGDKVLFTVIKEDEDTGFIESIEPRQSQLLRPAVANVDQLAIIIATKSPEPDFVLLDKLLVTAKRENIEPFICINKIDLDTEGNYVKIVESY
ncbi:MAG TPA: GTPase RsgA, partial [Clostridiaceae bacterium]|nr:GTPase RsgA [Clostridiaceae bacterium]